MKALIELGFDQLAQRVSWDRGRRSGGPSPRLGRPSLSPILPSPTIAISLLEGHIPPPMVSTKSQGQASLECGEDRMLGRRRDCLIAAHTPRQPKVASTARRARSA